MRTFDDMLSKQLQDEEFKKEYEAIQPEMDVIRAIVNARTPQNMTQKELLNVLGLTRQILVSLRMEQETHLLICLKGWQMEWEWLLRLSLYRNRKYDYMISLISISYRDAI